MAVTVKKAVYVKKVIVGNPVRKVVSGTFNINNLAGVDTSGATDGALLVYNGSSENFEATKNLDNENTNINGGNF